jgi:aryl-alcohol dehydrogenase-like predicted oxidoreductase
MYAWQFGKMLSISERNGWARFVTMQNHYNLIYREEEREMIPLCEAEGVGCLPWSPLARGLLAGARRSMGDRESTTRAKTDEFATSLYTNPNDWEVVEALNAVARERGAQAAEVALAWLMSKPAVTAPIVGTTKPQHLDAALRATELTLSAEEVEQLEAPYKPHSIVGHS